MGCKVEDNDTLPSAFKWADVRLAIRKGTSATAACSHDRDLCGNSSARTALNACGQICTFVGLHPNPLSFCKELCNLLAELVHCNIISTCWPLWKHHVRR